VSRTKYRAEYRILAILVLITAGIILLFVATGVLKEERRGPWRIRTTRSTNVDGAAICYELYDRMGIKVERSDRMLDAESLDRMAVLFVLDTLLEMNSAEVTELRMWLDEGGVLVSTEVPPGCGAAGNALRDAAKTLSEPGEVGDYDCQEYHQQVAERAVSGDIALTRDVRSVSFEHAGVFDLEDVNDEVRAPKVLFADGHGTRIAQCRVGQGHIIALADSSFLSNGNIIKDDNCVLAANLVAYALSFAQSDGVFFDEYHLGCGRHETGFDIMAGLLFTSPTGWSVLTLTAAGVMFLILKGRKFGTRRGIAAGPRRSKLEYVKAAAATYQSAGANKLVLELILRSVRNKAAAWAGLGATASNESIGWALANKGNGKAHEYASILNGCDALLSKGRISERRLTAAIKELCTIETEIIDGHTKSK